MTENISLPTSTIAANINRWKRNRDIISGSEAVKRPTAGYLHRLPTHDVSDHPQKGEQRYRDYLARTHFFPAANRILDGLKGMIFRKAAHLKASTALTAILDTITEDGWTVADLAENVVEEVFTTNFCGLYVDHPLVPAGASRAEAEKINARPFVHLYRSEAILEVTRRTVTNKAKIVRVRLLDDENTVRELILDNGAYTVIIHDFIAGVWVPRPAIVPLRNGKPLDEIPFRIVSTHARAIDPTKAVMDDVCELNVDLFRAQARETNLHHFYGNPILLIRGAKASDMVLDAGAALFYPDHKPETPVEVSYVEPSGVGDEALTKKVATLKEEISIIGSRIISPDTKSGVETAEAMTLRKANENSVLASYTKTISRAIKEILDIVAEWTGAPEVEFELSTDFLPASMTPQERAQVVAEWMAGLYPREVALEQLKRGEILPDDFDIQEAIEKVDLENANSDRPLQPMPTANTGEVNGNDQ